MPTFQMDVWKHYLQDSIFSVLDHLQYKQEIWRNFPLEKVTEAYTQFFEYLRY